MIPAGMVWSGAEQYNSFFRAVCRVVEVVHLLVKRDDSFTGQMCDLLWYCAAQVERGIFCNWGMNWSNVFQVVLIMFGRTIKDGGKSCERNVETSPPFVCTTGWSNQRCRTESPPPTRTGWRGSYLANLSVPPRE